VIDYHHRVGVIDKALVSCCSFAVETQYYLSHLPVLPDILCLQETQLTLRYYPNIPNYVMIRKDRPRALGMGGGICICVRNTLYFSEIRIPVINSCLEVMRITIND